MRILFILSTLLFTVTSVFAQTGPNGVGTNNIFWYKASDLATTNGTAITALTDKTANANNATQSNSTYKPTYSTLAQDQIDGEDVLTFDGNDHLVIESLDDINLATSHAHKSFTVVFKTSWNTTDMQIIYEQGGRANGMNLYIHNGSLCLGVYNNSTYNHCITYPVSGTTDYMVTTNFDSNSDELKVYINGEYIDQLNLTNFTINRHTGGVGLGGINGRTRTHLGELDGPNNGFTGSIGEMIYFNESLNETEVIDLTDFVGPEYGFTSDYESLPIELLSFSVSINDKANTLKWTTATELDNDYFTLEKSKDGIEFEIFEMVEGAGNSLSRLDYQIDDATPFQTTYYRLKQTDFDGKFTYSNIIVAENKTSNFEISMNSSSIAISTNEVAENAYVEVYTVDGKLVKQEKLQGTHTQIEMERKTSNPSILILRIYNGEQIQNSKILF